MKAKRVYESIDKVLKPKSSKEIEESKKKYIIDLRKTHLPYLKSIKGYFDIFPYFEKWIESFTMFKPNFYVGGKWKHKRTYKAINGYETVDVSNEAKEILKKVAKKFNKKLVVYCDTFAGGNTFKSLLVDLSPLRLNGDTINHGDNEVFKWTYEGDDYAYFGNPNGDFVFLFPEDFLENIFSRYINVNESLNKFLKPKSKTEAFKDIKNLISEILLIKEYLVSNRMKIFPNTFDNLNNLCKELNSSPNETIQLGEFDMGYDKFIKVLPHIYSDLNFKSINIINSPFFYVIDRKNKILKREGTFGSRAIFFNIKLLLSTIDIYINEGFQDVLKPKQGKELEEALQKLQHVKDTINEVDPRIIAVSPEEYGEMYPDQAEDFEKGNYLIVMDNEDELDFGDDGVLGGAYSVTLGPDLQVYAEWMPYPEEDIIGLNNFIERLHMMIDFYDDI